MIRSNYNIITVGGTSVSGTAGNDLFEWTRGFFYSGSTITINGLGGRNVFEAYDVPGYGGGTIEGYALNANAGNAFFSSGYLGDPRNPQFVLQSIQSLDFYSDAILRVTDLSGTSLTGPIRYFGGDGFGQFYGSYSMGGEQVAVVINQMIGFGGAQNDTFFGGFANDLFYGGRDQDLLDGGPGNDWLSGGDVAFSWGSNGARAHVADVNGDGRSDVLQIERTGQVNTWLSRGDEFADQLQWATGARPDDQFADVTGDGRADLIQVNNGNINVWTSNGTSFNNPVIWGHGARPTDQFGDVNADGMADLIEFGASGNIFVWTSNGSGFSDYAVWGSGARIGDQLGDFNGDGRTDVIELHENGNLYVWTSTGTAFSNYSVWGTGARPSDRLGDFNGDGRTDVIELHENGNAYVWTSNGSSFSNYSVWASGFTPKYDQIADVSGDGRDDIVEIDAIGRIYVWTANASGTGFDNFQLWGTGARPSDRIGDFNGDSRADIVELHENGNGYVWLSTGTSFAQYRVWGQGIGTGDGLGADTFNFGRGFGHDVITDFQPGSGDRIIFSRSVLPDYQTLLNHARDDAYGNTIIDDGAGNDVMLLGVTTSSLTMSDFLFS